MKPGDLVDRYRILDHLGDGGFGDVYSAEQIEPVRRTVALKVLRHDPSTRGVLSRFESEQQALALMEHRHIAKFYDAGTTETGMPYFAMELVQGGPLTEYCDSARLGVRARLRVFLQLCDAVAHAHQKGILHRDLKPSNVLVAREGDEPVVKVIDFGIAKALSQPLTDRPRPTKPGRPVGTPDYMSPEQMEGVADIDMRADVYALGVMLYELLTGFVPLDLPVMGYENIVREQEPARPSSRISKLRADSQESEAVARRRNTPAPTLARTIRGDLDQIVMKCLEKEREHRYDAVRELANDVVRFLEDRPVLARPQAFTYRAGKFIRRHQTGVMFAASAIILIGLLIGSYVGKRIEQLRAAAVLDRYEAEQILEDVRAIGLFDKDSAIEQLAHAVDLAPHYVPAKVHYCLELARRGNEGDLETARRLVAPLQAYVDIASGADMDLLDDQDSATPLRSEFRQKLYRDLLKVLVIVHYWERPDAARRILERLEVPLAMRNYALAFLPMNDEERVRLLSEAVAANPWSFDILWERAVARYRTGDYVGMYADATQLRKREESSNTLMLLGIAQLMLNDPETAIESQSRALALYKGMSTNAAMWKFHYNVAMSLRKAGNLEGAYEELLHAEDVTSEPQWDVQYALLTVEIELERLEEARARVVTIEVDEKSKEAETRYRQLAFKCGQLELYKEAIVRFEKIGSERSIARCHDQIAWRSVRQGDCAEALARTVRANEIVELATRNEREKADHRFTRGVVRWFCGEDLEHALADFRFAVAHGREWERFLAWEVRCILGDERADEDLEAAVAAADRALRILGSEDHKSASTSSMSADEWVLLKQAAQALLGDAAARRALAVVAGDPEHPQYSRANYYLGIRCETIERLDDARRHLASAQQSGHALPALRLRKLARLRGPDTPASTPSPRSVPGRPPEEGR